MQETDEWSDLQQPGTPVIKANCLQFSECSYVRGFHRLLLRERGRCVDLFFFFASLQLLEVDTVICCVWRTHLEGPFDAGWSSVRQLSLQAEAHSAAEQEYSVRVCQGPALQSKEDKEQVKQGDAGPILLPKTLPPKTSSGWQEPLQMSPNLQCQDLCLGHSNHGIVTLACELHLWSFHPCNFIRRR